jgi:PPOX class probable F420-dependent enzyme
VNVAAAARGDDEHRHDLARDRFAVARVARLATVDADGRPHLVPIVFAVVGDAVWSAVDGKPKSTRALRRLDNIRVNPRVSLLVDHYSDDWTRLWWVRLDGDARIVGREEAEAAAALAALTAKYPQYQADPPAGPLVRVDITRWSSWSHAAAQ